VAIAPSITFAFKPQVSMEHTQLHCSDKCLVAVETLLGLRHRSFM